MAEETKSGTTQEEKVDRSEEHTSELQSRGLISYAVFCLKKKKEKKKKNKQKKKNIQCTKNIKTTHCKVP